MAEYPAQEDSIRQDKVRHATIQNESRRDERGDGNEQFRKRTKDGESFERDIHHYNVKYYHKQNLR
ncbi:MAG: hypothetical protein ACTSUE_24430 [Promethearchaeota archaeon]